MQETGLETVGGKRGAREDRQSPSGHLPPTHALIVRWSRKIVRWTGQLGTRTFCWPWCVRLSEWVGRQPQEAGESLEVSGLMQSQTSNRNSAFPEKQTALCDVILDRSCPSQNDPETLTRGQASS